MTAPALSTFITGLGSVSGDNLNTFAQTCDTFSQMRAFTGVQGSMVLNRGGNAIKDGLQGSFYWNATISNPVDDGVNTIVPNGSVLGAWTRIFTNGAQQVFVTNFSANSSSFIYTPNPLLVYAMIEIVGGGGAGGGIAGSASASGGGGGGGSGAYQRFYMTSNQLAAFGSVTCTIPAVATGGAGNNPGGNGGTVSFGGINFANGGTGGAGSSGQGAAGGAAGARNFTTNSLAGLGQDGGGASGASITTVQGQGGYGAAGPFGGGGTSPVVSSGAGANGKNGGFYGAGGGGASACGIASNFTGGSGGGGGIIVTEFCSL